MVSWHSIQRESKLVGHFLPSLPTHSENSVEHESLHLETSEAAADEADKVAHTRDSKPHGNETIDNEELDKWSKYVKEASMVDAEEDFGIFTGQTRDVSGTEGGMQSPLQMMAQEEQQRQQIATLAAIASRPKEHYISIAKNGEFMIEDRTFFYTFFYKQYDSLLYVFRLFFAR
jgi:hypothetical protein